MDLRTILVPLDGSAIAESALSVAEGLAHRTGSKLILVRAAEASEDLAHVVAARLDAVREAEMYLDAATVALNARGYGDTETVAWYGPAADVILDVARKHEPDLIVMATRGRRGLGRLMFGSVTETVVRSAPTPVLVVRGDAPSGHVKNLRPVSGDRESMRT